MQLQCYRNLIRMFYINCKLNKIFILFGNTRLNIYVIKTGGTIIMGDTNTSITLYGKIEEDFEMWWEWYIYSKSLTAQLGYKPNYIGVISKTFNSGKVLTISRMESKLKKVIEDEESIKSLCVFSLPKGFVQATFDYHTLITRECGDMPHHITLTFSSKIYKELDIESIIEGMKNFIGFTDGEIYELPTSECPLLYAIKANPIDSYTGLRVINTF